MPDEPRFDNRAIDRPGTTICPHCQQTVDLPKKEPFLIGEGREFAPHLISMLCPKCRKRIYFVERSDEEREQDELRDQLEAEEE